MMDNLYAVIMAGGKGERFWPMSTAKRPKQVLSLVGGKPMIQLAVERVGGIVPPERVIVITSADLVDVICEAAPVLSRKNVIGEPYGRDTAAAVALASAIVKAHDPDGVFCVLTADHIIYEHDLFKTTLHESAQMAAKNNVLITIGIVPTEPSTAFGYIEYGAKCKYAGKIEFRQVERFVEKPDATTAAEYINTGKFCWNSGMFIWSVSAIQDALGRYQPQLLKMADKMESLVDSGGFNARLAEEYSQLDKISIDYAIMEKADNILMAKGAFTWHDVGSWPALQNHFDSDDAGNILIGKAEQLASKGNIVCSNERLTALIGVENLVVVQAEGATLVCSREKAQDVKKMLGLLREKGGYDDVL